MSKPISRVLSWTAIYLGLPLPVRLVRHYQSLSGPLVALFGLVPDGVYICPPCCQGGGALLPHLSTLASYEAVYFCCTFPGVASAGRYPASCPMVLGLSSCRIAARGCPAYSWIIYASFSSSGGASGVSSATGSASTGASSAGSSSGLASSMTSSTSAVGASSSKSSCSSPSSSS